MTTYEIRFNVHSHGSDPTSYTGHVNVTFIVNGVPQIMVGANVEAGTGVVSSTFGPLDG